MFCFILIETKEGIPGVAVGKAKIKDKFLKTYIV